MGSPKKKPLRLPEIMPGDQAYFQALGRFMHEFAKVENQTAFLLRRCTGLSIGMAKIVLAGPHAVQNAERIKAIVEMASPDPDLDGELKAAINQLKKLNNFRDDLVHFGAAIYRAGERTTTNIRKARNAEGLRNFPASPSVLRDATHDLLKIYEVFQIYAQPDKGEFANWWNWHKKLRAAAWRYKPPQEHARE